jgi:RNA recognition motif-containing protein
MDKSNLIVNYLQTNVTEEDLNGLFGAYGLIQSLKIVRDKATGISMGFGFVNFETNDAANRAADGLNGLELNGKRIKVSVARPAWKANIHSNLYVANLPTGYSEGDVLGLVGQDLAVHIEHVRMLKNTDTTSGGIGNEFRGVAVARFDTEESASAALETLCSLTIQSPVTGARSQIHAKPWRPEFRPERAAASSAGVAPMTRNRRKLSLDATGSSENIISAADWAPPPPVPSDPASNNGTALRAQVKPFVPASSRYHLPPPSCSQAPTVGVPISETEEAILLSSFEQFGAATGISVYPDRTWGYVRFPSMHAAAAAVNTLSGYNVNGKLLELEVAAI